MVAAASLVAVSAAVALLGLPDLGVAVAGSPEIAAVPVDPEEMKDVDFGRYHALVIGNGKYRDLAKIATALGDAQSVAAELRDHYGFEVTLLRDAKHSELLDALSKLQQLGPTDNLLIYFSGQGGYDEQAGLSYWLAVDAVAGNYANGVSSAELASLLKGLKARHILVVVDCSYCGTFAPGMSITLGKPDLRSLVANRVALSSAGVEPVGSSSGKHSAFAEALLRVLQGNPGIIDGETLFHQVGEALVATSPQTPQYAVLRAAGDSGGGFIFVPR